MPHTATNKGKRVRVVLRGGAVLEGRFKDRSDLFIILEGHGRVWKREIQSFIVLKGKDHRQ